MTRSSVSLPVYLLGAWILAASGGGCDGSRAAEAEPPPAGERDFVRYDVTRTPHDFIKIEAVKAVTAAAGAVLTGRVTVDEDHTQRLASPIDGRAVDILVKPGDRVRAGQPMVTLSSPTVGGIQADAQKSLSDLTVAEKSLQRARRLLADGAIADKEVAQLDGELRKSRADHERARAQLEALGVSPTDPAVKVALRARLAGSVVERNVLVGQEVRADQATPLLTVSNLDTVWVMADVYEQDLSLVHVANDVQVTVPAYPGETFAGRIAYVGEVLDPNTRTVKIRCVVPNADGRLKPEMFAKVRLLGGGGPDRIRVPAKAVLSDGDRSVVLVATEGMVFRLRPVDVGSEVDGMIPVMKGLIPGEKIVTDGAIFLKREIESR